MPAYRVRLFLVRPWGDAVESRHDTSIDHGIQDRLTGSFERRMMS